MKRKESTLACMKHFLRTATYDTTFFELFLQEVREFIARYGSVQFQLVSVTCIGYIDTSYHEYFSYTDFIEFIDEHVFNNNFDLYTNVTVRFYDYGCRYYYPLFSVYKEVHEKLYRRFQNAVL